MTASRSSYVAEIVHLFVENPDTPTMPSPSDWDIASDLFDRQIPIDHVQLAFKLAFVRRHNRASDQPLPPIKSLAYFRTVALNLSNEESEPAYADYIDRLYTRLRTEIGLPSNVRSCAESNASIKTAR